MTTYLQPEQDNRAGGPLRVLSLNCYIMGHVTYQDMLEKTFGESFPEIAFRSLHLTKYPRRDLIGRAAYPLMTFRLPWVSPDRDDDYRRYRTEMALSVKARRILAEPIREWAPQVLHLHTQSVALTIEPLARQIPTVVSIDITTEFLLRDQDSSSGLRKTYRPIIERERRCFAAAAHIISWSEIARRSVIDDYGIAPDKVTTIHPFIEPSPITHEGDASERTTQANPQALPRLLFVGNDFIRKGGEDLLAVYGEHFADRCALDIVSNSALDAPAHLKNVRVHRGMRPLAPELLDLYRKADVFVMPTLGDCFPMVFIESMAAGLPSIGTTVAGVPELVRDGINGLVITPGDRAALGNALERLVSDSALRRKLGLGGRRRAEEEFNPITNCGRIAAIFQNVATMGSSVGAPPSTPAVR